MKRAWRRAPFFAWPIERKDYVGVGTKGLSVPLFCFAEDLWWVQDWEDDADSYDFISGS